MGILIWRIDEFFLLNRQLINSVKHVSLHACVRIIVRKGVVCGILIWRKRVRRTRIRQIKTRQ